MSGPRSTPLGGHYSTPAIELAQSVPARYTTMIFAGSLQARTMPDGPRVRVRTREAGLPGLAGRGSCAKLHAMSQPKENSHAGTITIASILAVPVLYVAVLFGGLSYVARFPAWGDSRSAKVLEGFYTWLPATTFEVLFGVWAKIDPDGHARLVSKE